MAGLAIIYEYADLARDSLCRAGSVGVNETCKDCYNDEFMNIDVTCRVATSLLLRYSHCFLTIDPRTHAVQAECGSSPCRHRFWDCYFPTS